MKPFTPPTGRTLAMLATAALTGAMLTAPQAAAATTTPGLATCINQVAASGHADLLVGNPDFMIGTPGDDWWDRPNGVDRGDIACGLAGSDILADVFGTFVGGPGNDSGGGELFGLFIGGAGDDVAVLRDSGTFEGGPGNDTAIENLGTFVGGTGNDTVEYMRGGIYYGGPGDDRVIGSRMHVPEDGNSGTFVAGMGNDTVDVNEAVGVVYGNTGNDTVTTNKGRFDGGAGNDTVKVNYGTFIGGPGYDTVLENHGTCKGVEAGC